MICRHFPPVLGVLLAIMTKIGLEDNVNQLRSNVEEDVEAFRQKPPIQAEVGDHKVFRLNTAWCMPSVRFNNKLNHNSTKTTTTTTTPTKTITTKTTTTKTKQQQQQQQ